MECIFVLLVCFGLYIDALSADPVSFSVYMKILKNILGDLLENIFLIDPNLFKNASKVVPE